MREQGWFARLVSLLDLWLRLRRHRPRLRVGDGLLVLRSDPDPRWVVHSFVEWADAPRSCRACGTIVTCTDMLVRGPDGNVLVDYHTAEWRPTSLDRAFRKG